MKISFLLLSRWGHSSMMAVTKPSIVQNCESRPINKIIKKKRHAHSGEPGSCRTADGYARKASPGPENILEVVPTYLYIIYNIPCIPEAATSATGRCCSCAMKPTTENITKPANILVLEFTEHTIKASLKINYYIFNVGVSHCRTTMIDI